MIKFFKYFCEALIIYILLLFGKMLGLTLARKIFSFIFKKIGPIVRPDKFVEKNIDYYNQKFSHIEKGEIIQKMWSNYGMTFIEYMFLNKFRKDNKFVQISGGKLIDEIKKNGKPVIFVSGHFANFEIMSIEITKKNFKLATIYRPLNNIFLNPFMVFLRKKFICKNQIKKGLSGVRETMNYIKRGFNIALMIDQRVSEGEKIELFNKAALTTTLPAQLAIKYNLNIIPVFIKRLKDNTFKIEFKNPIKNANFKNKYDLTKKLNQELEEMIVDNPEQWIWTHNRWK